MLIGWRRVQGHRLRKTRLLRNFVPSAEADSVCSTSGLPALPCRAFTCRRFAAGIELIPPSLPDLEFRNGP